jgi:hypothetical protein
MDGRPSQTLDRFMKDLGVNNECQKICHNRNWGKLESTILANLKK